MIKIRYLDLPTGLHIRAEARGTDTIVYLLPGLTTAQRRAALHRARSSARLGHGPHLPATGLACAVAADRVRTTVRNGAAAMRVHPGLVIPPVIIMVSAVLAYLLLASVTMSVTYRPPGAGSGPQPNPVSQGILLPGSSHDRAGLPGRTARGHGRGSHPGRPGRPPGSPPPPSRSPGPSPSGHASPSPSPVQPSPSAGPPPAPSPSRSASPSPSPGGTGSGGGGSGSGGGGSGRGGGCVNIGPLGICIHL